MSNVIDLKAHRQRIQDFEKSLNASLKRSKSEGRIDSGKNITHLEVERISGGTLGMDVITCGGYPRGRATQQWGEESTAKTATLFKAMARAQANGHNVLHASAESFDKEWARTLGCKIAYTEEELDEMRENGQKKLADRLETEQESWPIFTLLQHTHGDGLLEMFYEAVKANVYDIAGLDSLAAIKKYSDIEERSLEDAKYGGESQLFSAFCGKMYAALNTKYDPKTNAPTSAEGWTGNRTAVVCINQARDKIGGWTPHGGPKMKAPGGHALRHFWHMSIEFSNGPKLRVKEKGAMSYYYGQTVQAYVDKSKIGPPHREAEWDFYFNTHGDFRKGDVDTAKEIFVWGAHYEVIERSGSRYTIEGEKLNGGEAAVEFLRREPSIHEELIRRILEKAKA